MSHYQPPVDLVQWDLATLHDQDWTRLHPVAGDVLVRCDTRQEKTAGGLILPGSFGRNDTPGEEFQGKPHWGIVERISPYRCPYTGKKFVPDVTVGERVRFRDTSGVVYRLQTPAQDGDNGHDYMFVREEQILCVIDPEGVFRATGRNIILRMAPPATKYKGTEIDIPQDQLRPAEYGIVIAVGKGPRLPFSDSPEQARARLAVEENQVVMLKDTEREYVGRPWSYKDPYGVMREMRTVTEDHIAGVLPGVTAGDLPMETRD